MCLRVDGCGQASHPPKSLPLSVLQQTASSKVPACLFLLRGGKVGGLTSSPRHSSIPYQTFPGEETLPRHPRWLPQRWGAGWCSVGTAGRKAGGEGVDRHNTDIQTGGTRPRERTVRLGETERSHSGGRRGIQGVQAWASPCCALEACVMEGQSPTFLGQFLKACA